MAPLQIILLLLVVRLPRSLAGSVSDPLSVAGFRLPFQIPPALIICSFLASHVLLVALVFYRTRYALKILNHPNASSVAVAARTESLFQIARWTTLALTAIHLNFLGLADIVTTGLATLPLLRHIPLLPEILYVTPALLSWIAFWAAAYQVESANRERSLPYRLAGGLPAHQMPSLPQFLSMHIRHNFYILVPIGAATIIEELAGGLDPYLPHAGELGLLLAFGCLLLTMPWFITHAWNTVPLRGPLRSELDAIAHQYRLRFKNILIWKTHNAITNAAILGYLPFSRYFLMTDALLESLTDQQIEAVFAHEVGHGVHRHIWWYLAGIVAAMLLSTAVTDLALAHLPLPLLGHLGGAERLGVVLSLGLIGLFIALGFPFISHRFEHQADWFAAQHMARHKAAHPAAAAIPAAVLVAPSADAPLPPLISAESVTLHQYLTGSYPHSTPLAAAAEHPAAAASPQAPASSNPVTLDHSCLAPGEIFISALDAIADLAHRSRNKKGWMHPSINHRIELLRTLAANPRARKSFQRRMLRARAYLLALLLLGVALGAYSSLHPPGAANTAATQESRP